MEGVTLMMSDQPVYQLWMGLKGLTVRLRSARYWTERRDACEELYMAARQAVAHLREASFDKDPDVSHWGRQTCEQLARDLNTRPEELLENIGNQIEKRLEELDGPGYEQIGRASCRERV